MQSRIRDEKPLLILMDGHAMVHRAFHGIQTSLTVSTTGEEVRGVYGFLNTFLRMLVDVNPTHCAIAFDLSGPTFRHDRYDEYKAHRPPTPPELRHQFDRVRQFMKAFKVPIFEHQGYEADDVLGTLSTQADQKGIDTIILTGDTDELQLVSPCVQVMLSYSARRTTMYDISKVKERYDGLGPETVADIKALQGDPSDNIPGVPSVGTKTAIKLLQEFGSVESIIEHIDEVNPPRIQQSIRDHKDQLLLGKFLTTIVRDVPVELDLDRATFWNYDRSEVVDGLRELEFSSMVPRIPESFGGGETPTQGRLEMESVGREINYRVVDTEEELQSMVCALDSSGGFAIKVEATTTNPMIAELVGLAFANEADSVWYVPLGHASGTQLGIEVVKDAIQNLLESNLIPKLTHGANYDISVLARVGINLRNVVFDGMISAHVAGRKSIDLESLAFECLNIELKLISDIIGKGRKKLSLDQSPIEEMVVYLGERANAIWQLEHVLSSEAREKKVSADIDAIEMPLVPVLVRMQRNGINLNIEHLRNMSTELESKITRIEMEMYALVGHEFNIGSSQQLGHVLINELGLPPTKKTKTGYSTDASSLEGLKQSLNRGVSEGVDPKAAEVLDQVIEYRQLSKIKSTYLDSLPEQVSDITGRIHTTYHQTGSATGRVSSIDPNVQNIPIRTDLGREVRKGFVAQNAPDWILLGADYSQIELRILAHLSRDEGLIDAFRNRQDIHASTASSVYDVSIDKVDSEMRRIAKIMNFGVVYGLSPFGISHQTGLTPEAGQKFIDAYFGRYPGIKEYIDSIKTFVKTNGYVETLSGRRRYIPEIHSSNFHVRAAGERMAINMPIQGTAADIIKRAMVSLQDQMDINGMHSLMIVQVHDELIFEVPKYELEQMESLIGQLMPAAMDLTVPLEVDLKKGYNWGEME